MKFPIVMRGYAIHDKRGENEAIKILETLGFLKDRPWKYDPNFLMEVEKGKRRHSLEDHEHRPLEEIMENKESWNEVEAIISQQQTEPIGVLAQAFPEP